MQLSLLDKNWNHIGGDAPSKEVAMHRAVYRARPDAGAVVHLHSVYVTALSCLPNNGSQLIEPHTPYLVMRLGKDIPLVPYYKPGDHAMEEQIFRKALGAKA